MEKTFVLSHVTMLGASAAIGVYAHSFLLGFGVFGVGIALLAGMMGIAETLKNK